jgi:hypothetical protein
MYADTLLCSHPRSGGRWLRYLTAHYLAARHRLGCAVTPQTVFEVVPDHHDDPARGYPAFRFRDRPALPLVAVCHQPFSWSLHRGFPTVFLVRNPYDVTVSAYFHLTREKSAFTGSTLDLIHHPRLGVPAWTDYINSWAPKLLIHRDSVLVSYAELVGAPDQVLGRLLDFLDETHDPTQVQTTVDSGNALRSAREIRTGQEGNFWDQLQPEEIFAIQHLVRRGLSDLGLQLLETAGVEVDPFPREA